MAKSLPLSTMMKETSRCFSARWFLSIHSVSTEPWQICAKNWTKTHPKIQLKIPSKIQKTQEHFMQIFFRNETIIQRVDICVYSLKMQGAHLAETQQSLRPIRQNINSVSDQISNPKEEKTSITVWIVKPDGGTTENHDETRRQHLHLQLRSGQLHNGKRVGAHGSLHHLRNWWFRFLGKISRKSTGVCRQDTHLQDTSVQYSLLTSAERTPRAWLKSHGLQCHLCAPENTSVIWFDSCLTLCCSRTCRWPRAHHLPHSLFLLPQHKNTQHNRFNMINSKNTQYIMHISMLSHSTSSAIKNYSGVKTCRVAETRARQLPHFTHAMSLKIGVPCGVTFLTYHARVVSCEMWDGGEEVWQGAWHETVICWCARDDVSSSPSSSHSCASLAFSLSHSSHLRHEQEYLRKALFFLQNNDQWRRHGG